MNTLLPIPQFANLNQAALPATQAVGSTVQTAFNQLLEQEVNKHNNDSHTPSQSKPKHQNQAVENTQDALKLMSASAAPWASNRAAHAVASANTAADKADDHQIQRDEDSADATVASAQMLALVSNLPQFHPQPLAKNPAEQKIDGLANAKYDKKASSQFVAVVEPDLADIQNADDSKRQNIDKNTDMNADKSKPLQLDLRQNLAVKANGDDQSSGASRTLADKPAPASLMTEKHTLTGDPNGANSSTKISGASVIDTAALATTASVLPSPPAIMMLSQQSAMSTPINPHLTPVVGSYGWDQAVSQKILWMAHGGLQSASLTLNPTDLGPLQVVLQINHDHADATFVTAQPEVKQALEAALPKLREMMEQAGIQLGQANVSTGTPNQQQGSHQQQATHDAAFLSADGLVGDYHNINLTTSAVRTATHSGQGLVDTFA